MIWLFAVVVVLAMGTIALVASGRGEPMVDEYDDRPDALVPATGDLASGDLRRVRFSLAFRGYRMSEVDALLTRLASQLESAGSEETSEPPQSVVAEPASDDVSEAERRPDDAPPG